MNVWESGQTATSPGQGNDVKKCIHDYKNRDTWPESV